MFYTPAASHLCHSGLFLTWSDRCSIIYDNVHILKKAFNIRRKSLNLQNVPIGNLLILALPELAEEPISIVVLRKNGCYDPAIDLSSIADDDDVVTILNHDPLAGVVLEKVLLRLAQKLRFETGKIPTFKAFCHRYPSIPLRRWLYQGGIFSGSYRILKSRAFSTSSVSKQEECPQQDLSLNVVSLHH